MSDAGAEPRSGRHESRADFGVIRTPSTGDVAGLAKLLGELGYPASPQSVEARLGRLALQEHVAVWVAAHEGAPVGLATAHALDAIHVDEPVAILTALVVAEDHRRRGIGRGLVETAEAWARGRGALRLTVATGLARTAAHAFYERLGFENTARRYSKFLSGVRP